MKKIIEKLRNEIKVLAVKQAEDNAAIRSQIQELAWKPGSQETVAALRSHRDDNGYRRYGKKALKPYRRPETGLTRYRLRQSMGHWSMRQMLVLYGMLRGLPYKRIDRRRS